MRKFLVKFTNHSGEYEFNGHTIIELKPRERITAQVHRYFMDFYGEGSTSLGCEKLNSYLYNAGEVAVDHISWRGISESDAEVLSRLNV
jgi:hypothetical protein